MCILGLLWVRDDFAPPFRDIKSCVSLSVRRASRFPVFIFCSHLYSVNWTGWADIEFLCMLGNWFWHRRRLLPAGRIRVCNTPRCKDRGPRPIAWQIAKGEEELTVTLIFYWLAFRKLKTVIFIKFEPSYSISFRDIESQPSHDMGKFEKPVTVSNTVMCGTVGDRSTELGVKLKLTI